MVRTFSVVQCDGRMGYLTTTFAIALWPDPFQSPEPDSLSEMEESTFTKSTHFGKDVRLPLPIKGMYPLLDLITEHGSSGLGELPFFTSVVPVS